MLAPLTSEPVALAARCVHRIESAKGMKIDSRVRLPVPDLIRKNCQINARTHRRARPAFNIVRAGIGNDSRTDAGSSKRVQRRKHRVLDGHESDLETPPAAFNRREDSLFLDARIDRMSDAPHCLDAVAHVSETTPKHVFVVIKPLPLVR